MPLELTIDQKARIDVAFTDRAGNPAKVDGTPLWASSDEGLFSVEPAEDGMSAYVVSGDETGDAGLLTVRADADMGEGMREVVGTLEVRILAGETQFISLTPGEAEPK